MVDFKYRTSKNVEWGSHHESRTQTSESDCPANANEVSDIGFNRLGVLGGSWI